MNELIIATSFFVLGFLSGAASLIALVVYIGKRAIKRKLGTKVPESAESRLKKVKELTQQQHDMQSYAEQPQKNSLDGKYKNGLIKEIKRLEEEKSEILQSIIKDGFDPEVSVINDSGEVKQMKLSEFMANMGITMPSKEDEPPVDTKTTGRFTVYRGGKDDGGETTH